jgi:tryptophan halogenase
MSAETRAIRSVCVAGAGIVGLSAAIAFARALPDVAVSIVETPVDPAALADLVPGSLPAIHLFHAAIGLDELELVREGIATHLLGARFDNWSADGALWFHVFGEAGLPSADVPFHQIWGRVRRLRGAEPYHHYSAAALLAAAGKFVHPSEDLASPLAGFLYALRLDPALYRARLDRAAAGLPRMTAGIADVERAGDGGIASLVRTDGRRVEADLYLDCTGPPARLRSVLDQGFEAWGDWLPCDRFLALEEGPRAPTPCDVVTGEANGWSWRSPLPDRTLGGRLWSSAFEAGGEGGIKLVLGRRTPWVGNVLALGDAAVALDPLHFANLHLAQSGILRALELLPGRDFNPVELAEYNRRTAQETARVRDFLALHYLRSGRADTPFWAAMARRTPPDSLDRTLEQFGRRARLPFFEEESFDRHSWAAALAGLGVAPEDGDALAAGIDLDRAAAAMTQLAAGLRALPDQLPPYHALLARMKAAPPAPGRRNAAIGPGAEDAASSRLRRGWP